MAKRDEVKPEGSQSDAAKEARERLAEQRRRDIEQAKKDRGDDGV